MILVIDNYDSFTYNIVDYLGKISQQEIRVFRNDKISIAMIEALNPSCIILSPGPKKPIDAGITLETIDCLGHQAIGQYFGGEIVKLAEPKHGKSSIMNHQGDPLFADIPEIFTATRYHSLKICKKSLPAELEVIALSKDDDEIMAIKHQVYPIYGIQFHPESIYTIEGLKMIKNFLVCTGVEKATVS